MVRSPLGELASGVHGLKTLLLCASHGGPTMISVLAWPTVLLLVLTASSQAQQTSPVQQTDDVAFHQELEKGEKIYFGTSDMMTRCRVLDEIGRAHV